MSTPTNDSIIIQSTHTLKIAIIGGGAAGFFLAVNLKKYYPQSEVSIFERSKNVLGKVKLSGGGRCNLTNTFHQVKDLQQVYPRGHRLMKRLLKVFNHQDTFHWFESHGVSLVTQEDECIFPKKQDSQAIIDCLVNEAKTLGVKIFTQHWVTSIQKNENGKFNIAFGNHSHIDIFFDRVAVTTGGAPRGEGYDWLSQLGHDMQPPCPSLYTFHIKNPALQKLSGIVVEDGYVAIAGNKFKANGPLLITHWGVSGPAILKLSSYAAPTLHAAHYQMPLVINWSGISNTEQVARTLKETLGSNGQKQMGNIRLFGLQSRLWCYLIERCGLSIHKRCDEVGKKSVNKLINVLTADTYEIEGKATYKEEFVTCGGVSLSNIHPQTLESKKCPGMYFAGEILDIDAITGGFNLQAAWTTAYVIAQHICHEKQN